MASHRFETSPLITPIGCCTRTRTPRQPGVVMHEFLRYPWTLPIRPCRPYPFENYTLGASNQPFYYDGQARYFGYIESIALQPCGYKALIPTDNLVPPIPTLTKFSPGRDNRIEVSSNSSNVNNTDIQIEFLDLMDCDSVTVDEFHSRLVWKRFYSHVEPRPGPVSDDLSR